MTDAHSAAHARRQGSMVNGEPESLGSAPVSRNGAGTHLSPSLLAPSRTAVAYELKFLLPHAAAERAAQWARAHLTWDPHGDPALNHAYRIESIYFDTDALDVYHQTATFKRRKFRLRRYGDEQNLYLERKTKSRSQVSKRRTLIHGDELNRLKDPAEDPTWSGYWFHRRLLTRQLRPRCVIQYERLALIGMTTEGSVRLTLDRHVRCATAGSFSFQNTSPMVPLFQDAIILELKFHAALPALFKNLMSELSLNPAAVSKYRNGIEACRSLESAVEDRACPSG